MSDAIAAAPVVEASQTTEQNAEPKVEAKESAPAPAPKKHKVKVDDHETEVDESELIRGYSKAQASQKRFEEAAKLRKEADEKLAKFKSSPIDALSELGLDPEELAEAIYIKKLEKAMQVELTPEEKQAKADQEELESYRNEKLTAKQQKEAEEFETATESQRVNFSEKISKAMEASNLSKDPYTIRSAALFIKSCLQNGFEPDAEEIREAIEGRVQNDYKSQVVGKKGKDLVKWLGEEVVNEIRRHDLENLRAGKKQVDVPKVPINKEPTTKPKLDKWQIQERVKKWSES